MKHLIITLACISMFAACKKDTTTPTDPTDPNPTSSKYVKFKAAGTSYEYTAVPPGSEGYMNYYDTSYKMISITLFKGITSSESGTIALSNVDLDNITVPFTANADTNLLASYPGFIWNNSNGTIYSSEGQQGVDPFPYFTITITSKTADVLEGTFSGLTKDSADVKMQITEGSFKMKLNRR